MILYVIGMTNVVINKKVPLVIDTINILVSTNIPDQKDISLTSKVIVGTSPNAAKYNEYPYITHSVKFKGGFLRNKSYNEILDFFFIKDIFSKYISTLDLPEMGEEPKKPNRNNNDNYEIEKKGWKQELIELKKKNDKRYIENLNYNIKKMLHFLFVTYPITGNIKNTTENNYIVTDIYNNNKYSYLNINSKNYTLSKAIWIDDKYNHYLTKQLVKDYKEFDAWRIGEIRTIETGISDNKKQLDIFIENIKKTQPTIDIFNSDILKIEKYLFNLSNWNNITQSLSTRTIRENMEGLYSHLIILQNEWNKSSIDDSIKKLKKKIDDDDDIKNNIGIKEKADITTRINNIIEILKLKNYNVMKSREFITELNRTIKIIIGSNLVPISNVVQNIIKDLNENNEKRITLENNRNYIKQENIILGNDKYNNENFKTLSNAFIKDIQLVKKNINFMIGKENFGFKEIQKLVNDIQNPTKITDEDAFGIIYDNNNVAKPKYEIYMYMDLTDGKVTDENRDNLDLCTFRDELLLIKFTQLINENTNLIQHDPLIKILAKENIEPKTSIDKPKSVEYIKPSNVDMTKKKQYVLKNNRTKKINV